ncbi:MAG: hypothetical protein K2P85_02230 [Flavobacteriaceae bacterium]|nr:hypothetical protein [Flavobacteriaceae bacterium]
MNEGKTNNNKVVDGIILVNESVLEYIIKDKEINHTAKTIKTRVFEGFLNQFEVELFMFN